MVVAVCGLSGCGTGYIHFVERNGGPSGDVTANIVTFDIDCVDDFEKTGGTTSLGSDAGRYSLRCTYQGKPLPWPILGEFHAAPVASGSWDRYRKKVKEKAQKLGCPGVAIRVSPPTENQEGEAIGAFCVSPVAAAARAQMPAGVSWSGRWDTSFGVLAMEEKGDGTVIGLYEYENQGARVRGALKGTMDGNALDFAWAEEAGGAGAGRGSFVISADGKSFEETWGTGSSATSGGTWRGTRM